MSDTDSSTTPAFGAQASVSLWREEADGIDCPIGYSGEYTDAETGFVYPRARYYDPAAGRFTQEDPHWNPDNMVIGSGGQPSELVILQSANLYAYTVNNPVMFADPWGLALPDDDNRPGNPGTAAQEQRDLNAANKNYMKTVWQKTSPVQPAEQKPGRSAADLQAGFSNAGQQSGQQKNRNQNNQQSHLPHYQAPTNLDDMGLIILEPVVTAIGVSLSGAFAARVETQFLVVYDPKGNLGIMRTVVLGGGTPNAGVAITGFGAPFARDIFELEGDSLVIGGSIGFLGMDMAVSPSGNINSFSVGRGLAIVDEHAGSATSSIIWSINFN